MKKISIEKIAKIIEGELICGSPDIIVENVVQDSRLVCVGDLFLAIVGDNANGHVYLQKAISKGAAALVISDETFIKDLNSDSIAIIIVEDTKKALGDLALWYLRDRGVKKIGVTGSVGKTTTKDLISAICKESFVTHSTVGNYNSEIGAALTALYMKEDAEIAIIEMGMDRKGEIHSIARYVRPDICVITNVGLSHIERLGSKGAIFEAKMEIIDFCDEDTKLIVYKDEFLNRERIEKYIKKKGFPKLDIIVIGEDDDCDIRFSNYRSLENGSNFTLETQNKKKTDYEINILGKHNCKNATLAIAVGKSLGIDEKEIADGLKKVSLTSKRLEIKVVDDIIVIDDTYNASPDSMKATLDVVSNMEGRKIAILGDMKELGEYSETSHKEIGEYAKDKADIIITYGDMARYISEENHFDTRNEILNFVLDIVKKGDILLFKGSNSMKLDELAGEFISKLEGRF